MKTIKGICPAVFALYTDETCRTLDVDAYREHVRGLVDAGVDALVTGGHAGEIAALTAEERATLTTIAREEAAGRIPVVGGVVSDSTAGAIRQGIEAQEAGADAVMITAPAIPGWVSHTGTDFMVRHYGAFEDAVGLPIVMFAAPSEIFGSQLHFTPAALTEVVRSVESIVAIKITSGSDLGGFIRCVRAIKEVRDVGCLRAGGELQFATYSYCSDGSLSGGTNFAVEDDIEVLKLVRQGDLAAAKELSDSWMGVWDVVYGYQVGLPVAYFHYRYKIAAWLLGKIDRPNMRLPQLPPPQSDLEAIRDALIACDKPLARDLEPLAVAEV